MKLTLRGIRECYGYTVEEVAEHCEVTAEEMEGYEKNCRVIMSDTMVKMSKLYGLTVDCLFSVASEAEIIEHNRKLAASERVRRAS